MVRWGRYYSVRGRVKWRQYCHQTVGGAQLLTGDCQLPISPSGLSLYYWWILGLETWDWILGPAIALTVTGAVPILRHLRQRTICCTNSY